MLTKLMLRHVAVGIVLVLSGCATVPTGPSVLVLPAPGKPFELFQGDDMACRQWAGQQTGISAQETVNRNTAGSAVVGTLVGGAAGALIGAGAGNAAAGAAIGGGSGLLLGTAAGSGAGQAYGMDAQQKYDYAYVQCMYAKGNQIPGQVHRYRIRKATPSIPPPPPSSYRNEVPPDYVPSTAPRR